MKQPLTGIERAKHQHLDAGEYWQLNAVAATETDHIVNRLIPQAVNNLVSGKAGSAGDWNSFGLTLKAYLGDTENPQMEIMRRARGGDFERVAPLPSSIRAMFVLFWLAAGFEISAFAVQGFFAGTFNAVILLQAGLLAVGGYLTGAGFGYIRHARWTTTFLSERTPAASTDVARMALGITLMLVVAAFRGYGTGELVGGMFVFVVTLLLGSTCALFEALHTVLRERRRELLVRQEQAQGWVASEVHRERFVEYQKAYEENLKRANAAGGLTRVLPT